MATGSCRILVVDDHVDSATLLSRLLRMDGHVVQIAGTVAQALALCEKEKFDVLISDIGLPDGSGHELMSIVQKRYGMCGIALSGRATSEDVAASKKAGFYAHLVKPVMLPDVTAAIQSIPSCGKLQ